MNFINRKEELEALDALWRKKQAQLVVFYGKRRVGKTELIKQFIKGKSAIYYLADKRTQHDQVRELGKRVGQHFNDSLLERNGFQNWLEMFEYLQKHVTEGIVLAIDEYPYLTESDSATGSLFQKGWDEYLKNSSVFLILCGSSISMMESETLAHPAPLYGRRTAQFLIQPMGYQASWDFFPRSSFETFLSFYTVTGGMPAYLTERAQIFMDDIFFESGFINNFAEFVLAQSNGAQNG